MQALFIAACTLETNFQNYVELGVEIVEEVLRLAA